MAARTCLAGEGSGACGLSLHDRHNGRINNTNMVMTEYIVPSVDGENQRERVHHRVGMLHTV